MLGEDIYFCVVGMFLHSKGSNVSRLNSESIPDASHTGRFYPVSSLGVAGVAGEVGMGHGYDMHLSSGQSPDEVCPWSLTEGLRPSA